MTLYLNVQPEGHYYWDFLLFVSGHTLNFIGIIVHGLNTVYVLVDRAVSAAPIRLLHFWHTSIMGISYAIFLVIYWAAGGLHPVNKTPYVYALFNFEDSPGTAVGWVAMVALVISPVVHVIMYFYVLLTSLCCNKKNKVKEEEDKGEIGMEGVENKTFQDDNV